MINQNRIVPIEVIDLLTMYGTAIKLGGTSITVVTAANPGEFKVTGTGSIGNVFANEPVKTLDFVSGVTAAVAYFVPSYDFKGFAVAGTAVTTLGDEVTADGRTLYTATLSDGAVTIAKVGL